MCRCFCNCKILHARPLCVFVGCFVLVALIAAGIAIAYYWTNSQDSGKKTWTCSNSSCKICENLEDSSAHLENTMCANITYFSEDEGFLYIVSVNQTTLVNETLIDPDVSPACSNISYADKNAKACIYLYNMNASNSTLHICAKIETTQKLHLLKKYELGCTDVHSSMNNNNNKKIVPKNDPTVLIN